MSDLEELKRLAQAATPGGWHVGRVYRKCSRDHGKGTSGHGGPDCVYEEFGRDTVYDAEGTSIYADSGEGVVSGCPDGASISEPNARYMAAANPAAVLALIERVAEAERRANVAFGWNTQNCPTATQAVLESIALRTPMPDAAKLEAFAKGDRARASEDGQRIALNERIKEARAPLLARLTALERFVSQFAKAVTDDLRAIEQRGKGGMQVTPAGDFVSAPPSVQVRLRWWAERAKEALATGKDGEKVERSTKKIERGEDTVRVYELWKREPDGTTMRRLECAECGHVFQQWQEEET